MYVTISCPETCTEHEHTTDTQNEKERTSPEFVFFKVLFIQSTSLSKKVQYFQKERKSNVKMILQSVNVAVRVVVS